MVRGVCPAPECAVIILINDGLSNSSVAGPATPICGQVGWTCRACPGMSSLMPINDCSISIENSIKSSGKSSSIGSADQHKAA